jgi:hypothetical protein
MKVIYNHLIPFRGFKCINLFGILFVRKGCVMTQTDYNHEAIHTAQMKELLYLPFYLLYVLEWLCRLIQLWDSRKAYRAISHEREAYDNQANPDYLTERKPYNQFKKLWH